MNFQSVRTYFQHTKRYYAPLLHPKSIRALTAAAALTAVAAGSLNAAVTHAGVAEWVAEDVISEEVLNGNYEFILNADAPPESSNRFHLQMPMMMEGYLDKSIYVSDGSGTANGPKLDTALEMTTKPSFFNAEEFELATPEEWEDAAEDATEFIESRPPKSGLE